MPSDPQHHPRGCACAQHNWGVGHAVSHDDGCPRRYPRVRPSRVMIRWNENTEAGAAFRASVADSASGRTRLCAAAASFYESYLPTRPTLTVVPDQSDPCSWEPSSDAQLDALIDSIAERVRRRTPAGVAGDAIETAIAATLERAEAVVESLERELRALTQRNEVDEVKLLNARIDRLVDDVPSIAAVAVNDVLRDLNIAGADSGAITGDVTVALGEQILRQIPEVVETYLRHRDT